MVSSELTCDYHHLRPNLVSILMSRSSDEIVGIITDFPEIHDGYIHMFDSSELLKLEVGKKFLSLHMVQQGG